MGCQAAQSFRDVHDRQIAAAVDGSATGVNPGEHIRNRVYGSGTRPIAKTMSAPLKAPLRALSVNSVEILLCTTAVPEPEIFARDGGDNSIARGS
jgi:hypothetical protein